MSHDAETIEIRLFLEGLHARYGLDMRGYSPNAMHRRVMSALARTGLAHVGELQHRVLHDPAFFASIVDDLTVRVSGMFRDPAFYREFRSHVVPLLRTYPLPRIWHAGCATGEEVYATAIVLVEEGLYNRAQIYATDVSAVALDHAKQGIFPSTRLAEFAASYAETGGSSRFTDYYTEAYQRIAFKESLRRNVLFFEHNLVSDHVFGEVNVVFCRNVLIYFGPELRRQVLVKIAQSLCPGGFLCLGSSEQLSEGLPFTTFSADQRIYRYIGT